MLQRSLSYLGGIDRDKAVDAADAADVIIARLEIFASVVEKASVQAEQIGESGRGAFNEKDALKARLDCETWLTEEIAELATAVNSAMRRHGHLNLSGVRDALTDICNECVIYALLHGEWIDYAALRSAAQDALDTARRDTHNLIGMRDDFQRWEDDISYDVG